VTDADALLMAARDRDPVASDTLRNEPELALCIAVQDAVPPPGVRGISRLSSPETGAIASVKAEPWPATGDLW